MFIGFFRICVPLFRRGLGPEITALAGAASPQRLDMPAAILTNGLSRKDQTWTSVTNPRLTCPICMHREAVLIPAPRHVPAWDDLTGPEQMAMLAELGAALCRGTAGFVPSSNYGHFHLREAKGARLTTVGRDPLLPLLAERLDTAQSVDLAIAFAMDSGVALDIRLTMQAAEPGKKDSLAQPDLSAERTIDFEGRRMNVCATNV